MISASTSSATLRVLENGALKTGNAAVLRGVQVHLIGADAEAADADEPGGVLQYTSRQLRSRADTHEIGVRDGLDQFRLGERLRMRFDPGITVGAESFDGARVDAFEQQDLDFALVEGGFVHERGLKIQCRTCYLSSHEYQ